MQVLEQYVFKTTPWDHQRQAFQFALDCGSQCMLAMDMRTGKTKVAIDLIMNRNHKKILIAGPLSIMDVWPDEFEIHGDDRPMVILALKKGSVLKRTKQAWQMMEDTKDTDITKVIIVNYECLRSSPFAEWTLGQRWDIVICDESHRIGKYGSLISKHLFQLGKRSEYKLCLTGTPMHNSPLDVFGQYRFLDVDIFGRWWTPFRAQYAILGGESGKEIWGFKNLEELNKKFYSIAFRVKRTDVMDLPKQMHEIRKFDLEPETRKIYNEFEKEFIVEVNDGTIRASNALVKLLRLQQITGGFASLEHDGKYFEIKTTMIGSEKYKELCHIFEDLDKDIPIVVFAKFTKDIENICKAARSDGRRDFEYSGKRKEKVEWENCTSGGVIAIQIKAGGESIDLTKSHYCVYYSTGFDLGAYEQSLPRLHSSKQKHNVTYIHLIARKTIDEKVYWAMKKGQKIIDSVLEGYAKGA